MFKKLTFSLLFLICFSSNAAVPPTFHSTMRGALECLDYPDTDFYAQLFQKVFNQPGEIINGAIHFKVNETMYGQPVNTFYVSQVSGYGWQRPIFIAAIFSTNRDTLQKALQSYPGLKFLEGSKFGYSFNYTQSGIRVYELDGNAIMMCITQ
jgi:hypothetical protein